MDTFLTLLSSALSVGSGGIFGIIGGIAGNFLKTRAEIAKVQADREWEARKWEREDRLFALQMSAKQQDAENELAIVAQQGSWDSLSSSIQSDTLGMTDTHVWVKDIKALFRPFLTLMLWIQAAWVFYLITQTQHFAQYLDTVVIIDLVEYMVYVVFFTAATAGGWWFAERALSPSKWKNN